MTAAAIAPDQIRALQATRRRVGITDEDWRARLVRDAGVESTRDLTSAQATSLLLALRRESDDGSPSSRMAGPYGRKAQVLWISAYWLGIVHDRRDGALLAFVRRQTGIQALAWVRSAADGQKVVEALKGWIGREAGLSWQSGGPKEVVLKGIFLRLAKIGAYSVERPRGVVDPEPSWREIEPWCAAAVGTPADMRQWTDRDFDRAIAAAGRKLRKAMAAAREEG